MRVLNEEGEQVGVMSRNDALSLAQENDVDIVLIAPTANPPVAKLIEWSKFKYDYSKKQRHSKQNTPQIKEMWFKPLTDVGDMQHKVKKIREFLEDRNKVKITVKPNRKTYRLDRKIYFELLERVLAELTEEALVEIPPRFEGKNVSVIIKSSKK